VQCSVPDPIGALRYRKTRVRHGSVIDRRMLGVVRAW
jgi:hypothetical protein